MPSERIQRQISALLDQAEEAVGDHDWAAAAAAARAVLAINPDDEDASAFLSMAIANGVPTDAGIAQSEVAPTASAPGAGPDPTAPRDPESFVDGRYQVLRFLGEGGKKRVFLAHDTLLDRDIAFSLIKTEGLDDVGRERILREAQAMGRLTHQNIVAIYDIGEHTRSDGSKQPFLVQELMAGGDVEDLLKEAGGPLPLERSLDIAISTAQGLEYAHAQRVVHRDLKPGNVWLTTDGVAKIGDLGLAVTLGQTRLTTHGTMVGTYQYMPPEQAIGQEVTERADLYSLGAMLYEMVTGRVPFQGDTPSAVISQHLNTLPVAPSWHTDHCPPELEELILRLLAKVPGDRPASATAVIAALTAVNPDGRSVSRSDRSANPLDRLAHGVFVGREHELEQLREALDGAMQGRGSVVMLVGEPGIGKTRTVQELSTYARMRGAEVLWGRSHESEGAPAFWPWVQIGNAYVASLGQRKLSRVLIRDAERLQVLFPVIRDLVPDLPEPAEEPSEAARFLLFAAYTEVVKQASAEQPVILVLDDLQWADRPTLQLLQFMAGELASMNLLIVATYRDTDIERAHPLSDTLAALNRESGFRRIVLKGLEADEVAAYVRQRASIEPSDTLLTRIYEETEGNPFFLSEIVNLLAEEGSLDSPSEGDITLPAGVREALGRRLDRLSTETNELLQTAAVVGREFTYETLSLLEERGADAVLGLVDEALAARVLEETDVVGGYRFSHALMQETLLSDMSATRRLRLHGQIAEALEQHLTGQPRDQISALARHFSEAAELTPELAPKAAEYCRVAADQSARSLAWDEAASLYERCLKFAADGLELDPELHHALGRAAKYAAEWRTAWVSTRRAIELYREAGRFKDAAVATLLLVNFPSVIEARLPLVDRALQELGTKEDAQLRAKLLVNRLRMAGLEPREDDQYQRDLDELRQQHQFPDVEALVTALEVDRALHSSRLEEAIELANRSFEAFCALDDAEGAAGALHARSVAAGQLGNLDAAKAMLDEQYEFARTSHLRQEVGHSAQGLAGFHLARCEFDEMEKRLHDLPVENFTKTLYAAAVAEQSGDLTRAQALLPPAAAAGGVPGYLIILHGVRARVFFNAGKAEEALEELEDWKTALAQAVGSLPNGMTPIEGSIGLIDECLAELGDAALVEQAYRILTTRAVGAQPRRTIEFRGLDHARGALAVRLGLIDDAQSHFETGRAWAARERCPVWEGRCHQGLAEVAELQDDEPTAMIHLEQAASLFAEHGANLHLEQVLAKRKLLGA